MIEETEGLDAFQIQDKSFDIAKEFDPDESLLKIMCNSVFNEGIDFDGIRDVFGVESRDKLLEFMELSIQN